MVKKIIKGIFAGAAISLGGIANISSGSKLFGSLFFVIGLFLVLTTDLNLFTGKVCYVFDNKPKYIPDLIIIYLSNLIGASVVGYALRLDKFLPYAENYSVGLSTRMDYPFWQVIILGFFCNVLIYIAVNGYKTQDKEWKKVCSLFFGVSVFVLCGFEHSVADMFYISFCNMWSGKAVLFLLSVTIGNILGGIIIPLIKKLFLDGKEKTDRPTESACPNESNGEAAKEQ